MCVQSRQILVISPVAQYLAVSRLGQRQTLRRFVVIGRIAFKAIRWLRGAETGYTYVLTPTERTAIRTSCRLWVGI